MTHFEHDDEEEPQYIHGRRKDYKPTGQVILSELNQIKVIVIQQAGIRSGVSDNIDTAAQCPVRLTEYETAIYTNNPAEIPAFPVSFFYEIGIKMWKFMDATIMSPLTKKPFTKY